MVVFFFMIGTASPEALSPRLEANIAPAQITIGDRSKLIVSVDLPEGYEVVTSRFLGSLSPLEIKAYGQGEVEKLQNGLIRHTIWAELTTYTVGMYTLPPLSVIVRSPEGTESTLQTLQHFVEVQSVVPEGDPLEELRDIKGPLSLKGFSMNLWLVFLLLGLMMVGVIFLKRRDRKLSAPPAPPLPPHVVALRALDEIAKMNLLQRDVKEYYFRVSGVLRRYLEDRFGVNAPEQTTEEFLETISKDHILNTDQKETLRSFLEQCDLVKFAKLTPDSLEAKRIHQTAREFVLQTQAIEKGT